MNNLRKYVETVFFCMLLSFFYNYNILNATIKSDSYSSSGNSHQLKVNKQDTEMTVSKRIFGKTQSNQEIYIYTLKNDNGLIAELINYGAILVSIQVPDRDGRIEDIVLGYDNLEGFELDPYYFGATIGRVANRTGGARFSLDGQVYELAPNTLPDFGYNHLHGGIKGFNKVIWNGVEYSNESEAGVRFTYLSRDGEEGYPGNVTCQVTYTLNNKNELCIKFKATTDRSTLVNMTHHSYFNLAGAGSGDILDHRVKINAEKYTPADDDLIPTGEIVSVKGLPVDFTDARPVGSQFDKMQRAKFRGYDLNYVLNHTEKDTLDIAARVIDPVSGRLMEVYTSQPCMHFYTSNFLERSRGKGGKIYEQYGAVCFEPQGFPDAPNKPEFESIELRPGQTYEQTIIYKFLTQ
jgi:aldose 1-epimerase